MANLELNAGHLAKKISLTVKVKGLGFLRFRFYIGSLLIRSGAKIAGVGLTVSKDG